MRYFATPTVGDTQKAMREGVIDCITTPAQGNRIPEGAWYCADNGCFGKNYVGDEAWFRWLCKRPHMERCRFATAPDVVGDAAATLKRSRVWLPMIRDLGIPAALVAQDGLEDLEVPWDTFDVLFIGGTTEWKLGQGVRDLVAEAKSRGKWVHMGRVNSARRLRYANEIGCDSADGTFISFAPTENLPRMLRWLDTLHPTLFPEGATP